MNADISNCYLFYLRVSVAKKDKYESENWICNGIG